MWSRNYASLLHIGASVPLSMKTILETLSMQQYSYIFYSTESNLSQCLVHYGRRGCPETVDRARNEGVFHHDYTSSSIWVDQIIVRAFHM